MIVTAILLSILLAAALAAAYSLGRLRGIEYVERVIHETEAAPRRRGVLVSNLEPGWRVVVYARGGLGGVVSTEAVADEVGVALVDLRELGEDPDLRPFCIEVERPTGGVVTSLHPSDGVHGGDEYLYDSRGSRPMLRTTFGFYEEQVRRAADRPGGVRIDSDPAVVRGAS